MTPESTRITRDLDKQAERDRQELPPAVHQELSVSTPKWGGWWEHLPKEREKKESAA